MMTRTQLLAALLTAGSMLLGGCASTSGNLPPVTQEQRLAAMAPWAAKGNLMVIEVPSTSNPLSNQMAIAALKAGSSSNTADQIVQILRTGSATTLAVMGNNVAMNAATIQAALRDMAKSSGKTRTVLLLVGAPEDITALKAAASAAQVQLDIAPTP